MKFVLLNLFFIYGTLARTISVRSSSSSSFGCSMQKACLGLNMTYNPCTGNYTMCLDWTNCPYKTSPDTMSHVCSFAFGSGTCQNTNWASGTSHCMTDFSNWPANNYVCVTVPPNNYAYYGVKDRSTCSNSSNPLGYTLVDGVSGDCVAADTNNSAAYPYFYDCADGNTGACLWRFLAPPAPENAKCNNTTSCVNSTITVTDVITDTVTDTVTATITDTITKTCIV